MIIKNVDIRNNYFDIPFNVDYLSMRITPYSKTLTSTIQVPVVQYTRELDNVYGCGKLIKAVNLGGRESLKNIINNISDISYQDLKVNDGKKAILKWRIYEKTGDKKIKEELLSYCRQDSIALIKIYNFLLEKVEDNK